MRYLNLFISSLILIVCVLFSLPSHGQVEIKINDSTQRIIDRAIKKQEKISKFTETCDSLFFKNDFETLQALSKKSLEDNDLRQYAELNLIAVLFFLGEVSESEQQFISYLDNDTGFSFREFINGRFVLLNRYIEFNPSAQEKINSKLLNQYRISKSDTLQRIILNFYANDQWIRRYFNYINPDRKDSFSLGQSQQFRERATLFQVVVYNFYQSTGRLLTKEDLKEDFGKQFVLLAHETDMKKRKFYLQLIKAAVSKNECEVEREINYELTNEKITNQVEFWKNYEKIVQQARDKYNLPDFNYTGY